MKRALIKRAYIWANTTLPPMVVAFVLTQHETFPDFVRALLDPIPLAALAAGIVSGGITMALSKWLGIPVAMLQGWLDEAGLEPGKQDGDMGPKTMEALKKAVNSRVIRMPDKLPPPKKPAPFKIPGGKRP